jgi:hypothetical protein
MMRRLFFAVVAVYLNDFPSIQVMLVIAHCVIVTAYIVGVKPFTDPVMNRMEILNELFILAATYHMIVFTDFVPNVDT